MRKAVFYHHSTGKKKPFFMYEKEYFQLFENIRQYYGKLRRAFQTIFAAFYPLPVETVNEICTNAYHLMKAKWDAKCYFEVKWEKYSQMNCNFFFQVYKTRKTSLGVSTAEAATCLQHYLLEGAILIPNFKVLFETLFHIYYDENLQYAKGLEGSGSRVPIRYTDQSGINKLKEPIERTLDALSKTMKLSTLMGSSGWEKKQLDSFKALKRYAKVYSSHWWFTDFKAINPWVNDFYYAAHVGFKYNAFRSTMGRGTYMAFNYQSALQHFEGFSLICMYNIETHFGTDAFTNPKSPLSSQSWKDVEYEPQLEMSIDDQPLPTLTCPRLVENVIHDEEVFANFLPGGGASNALVVKSGKLFNPSFCKEMYLKDLLEMDEVHLCLDLKKIFRPRGQITVQTNFFFYILDREGKQLRVSTVDALIDKYKRCGALKSYQSLLFEDHNFEISMSSMVGHVALFNGVLGNELSEMWKATFPKQEGDSVSRSEVLEGVGKILAKIKSNIPSYNSISKLIPFAYTMSAYIYFWMNFSAMFLEFIVKKS